MYIEGSTITHTTDDPINFQTTRTERVSYGFYFLGQNVFYFIIVNFLQIFLTDQGLTAGVVATIFMIAKTWDAVNDPIFGVIIDRAQPEKGKFLPWIRASIIPIAITTILLFSMPASISMGAKIAWASIAYILWGIAFTLCDAPIFALTTAMTENIQERTVLLSIGRIGAGIGATAISIAVPLLYPKIGWQATMIALAIIGAATMLPVTQVAEERILRKKEEMLSPGEIWNYLKGNKYLLIFYASMLAYNITNTTFTIGPFFAINNLGSAESMVTLTAIIIIPMLILAGLVPTLTKRFGKFKLYIFSIIWFVISSVLMYLIGYENTALFLIILFIRSMGYGITTILTFMFTPDCVEYGTFKTGERAEGIIFSLQTFATKLVGGLSVTVSMAGLAFFGFVEGSGAIQSAETLEGIWLMLALFPVVGALLSLIVLNSYKLRDNYVQVMVKVNNGELGREESFQYLPDEFHIR